MGQIDLNPELAKRQQSYEKIGALSLFYQAIWRRKWVFTEAIVATIFINLLALATAIYSMQIYDRVVPNAGLQTLWVLTFGVIIAVLFELLIKQVRALVVDRACKDIDLELSDRFFGRAIAIRMDQRPPTVGTFAAQIRLFEQVRNFLTSTSLFLLADVPFALLFIGVIALIGGPVAIVPLLLLPLSILVGFMFIKPVARLTNETTTESTIKNGLLIESIDGIETIKSLKGENAFIKRWRALSETIGLNDLKLKSYTVLSTHLSQLIQQISYIGLVAFGVYEIGEGNLTMGGLIAITIISGRALQPLAQVANVMVQWQQTKASLLGLEAIMKSPVDGELSDEKSQLVAPETCRHQVALKDISFGYDPKYAAVQVPQLVIQPGERVAIVGPVGSGKSTLLKLLSGLYQPNSGRVFLDNIDMSHLEPNFLRDQIHYFPQDARLFNGTLRDNLTFGHEKDPGDEAILNAARTTGLDALIAAHPRGLGLYISEGGHGLSGGQRQLVALTRLLLQDKGIMLLDEPTASMDGNTEERIAKVMFDAVPEQGIMVLVTHKLSLLKYVQRVIVMDKGKLVLDGPRDAVLAKIMPAKQPAATGA